MDPTTKRPPRGDPYDPASTERRPDGRAGGGDRIRPASPRGPAEDSEGERANDYADSASFLKAISTAFVEKRRKGRTSAWADLQAKVMGNAHLIVPTLLEFDRWMKMGIDIETFMKSEEGIRAEDPMALLRSYLSGDPAATAPTTTKARIN